MKACVLYLSRTGNTKRFAEAVSESIQSPMFNLKASDPSDFKDFDLLLIGTPVTGFNAAPQVTSFIKKLPEGSGKRTILFCTYALAKGKTFKTLEKKTHAERLQEHIVHFQKSVKLRKNDFKNATDTISKAIQLEE